MQAYDTPIFNNFLLKIQENMQIRLISCFLLFINKINTVK